jgi:hypothetical protein
MFACGGRRQPGGAVDASPGGGAGGSADGGAGGSADGPGGDDAAGGVDAASSASDAGSSSDGRHDTEAPALDAAATTDGSPSATACKLPEGLPLTPRLVPNVPGTRDFAFDKAGNVVAVQFFAKDLLATPYQGMPALLLAGAVQGTSRGTRFLPGGELLIVDGNSLVAIDSQNRKRQLAAGLPAPWGLAVDPQGRAYVATAHEIVRVDAAGQSTVISSDSRLNGTIALSPGYDILYVTGLAGEIRKASIGADGKADPQQRLAVIPNAILMGITVDECGNLYVSQGNREVWHVTPTGLTTRLVAGSSITGGLHFGSGRGGWKETALYISAHDRARAGLQEVELGFRGMKDPYLETP